MDDKNFRKDSAIDWINLIEASPRSARDQDVYPLLQLWIEENKPQNVLDVGCGQGICCSKIQLGTCQYVGVDPSPVLVDRARELYSDENCEFRVANIYSLPFRTASFDAAFSVAVWHLLEDSDRAASEVARVLKPSGSVLLIMADPSAYSAWTTHYEEKKVDGVRFEGTSRRADGSVLTDVLYLRSKEDISEGLEAAGLKITAEKSFRNQMALSCRKV